MNIAGFNINRHVFITLCVIVGSIAIFSLSSYMSDRKAKQRAIDDAKAEAEEAARLAALQDFSYDAEAELQKRLVQQYGEPPEGFKWAVTGDLRDEILNESSISQNFNRTY